jgi:hypothetical protein
MEAHTIYEATTLFEKLLEQASASAFIGSLVFGWSVMLFVMFPIKKKIKEDDWATFYCRAVCFGCAFLWALLLWPHDDVRIWFGWAGITGASAGPLWWIVTHVIGWISPTLAAALKLKRVSLDDDSESGAHPSDPSPPK